MRPVLPGRKDTKAVWTCLYTGCCVFFVLMEILHRLSSVCLNGVGYFVHKVVCRYGLILTSVLF